MKPEAGMQTTRREENPGRPQQGWDVPGPSVCATTGRAAQEERTTLGAKAGSFVEIKNSRRAADGSQGSLAQV